MTHVANTKGRVLRPPLRHAPEGCPWPSDVRPPGRATGPVAAGDRARSGDSDVCGGPPQMEYSPEKDSNTQSTTAGIAKNTPMMNSHQPIASPANMIAPEPASQRGVHELATK